MTTATTSPSNFRLCAVSLDGSFGRQTDKDQKREQAVTIFDLLDNKALHPLVTTVDPIGCALPWPTGGWSCESPPRTEPVLCHHLSLPSFSRLLRDYGLVCNSYSDAMAGSVPQRLEAMDMGRRAIHNEASEQLRERLRSQIKDRCRSGDRPSVVSPKVV
ncbi:UPF0262 family protein [Sinorhizobium meliloti]